MLNKNKIKNFKKTIDKKLFMVYYNIRNKENKNKRKGNKMKTNENLYKEYVAEITKGNKYYKISLKEFKEFLKKENLEEHVRTEIEEGGYTYTALDYAVPIIILKAL